MLRISGSSLVWSALLTWRLRSLLLWGMNNTLLFLVRALHKPWLGVSSGGREQGIVPAGCLSTSTWPLLAPPSPSSFPGGHGGVPHLQQPLLSYHANGRRILHWTKSCFQVMFDHLVSTLLCRSAIHKPRRPAVTPGLRTSWHQGTGSQLCQRQTPLLHQFTPP